MSKDTKDKEGKKKRKVEKIWEHRDGSVDPENPKKVSTETARKEAIEAIQDSRYFVVFAITEKMIEESENDPSKLAGLYRSLHPGFYSPFFCESMSQSIRELVNVSINGGGKVL